MTPTNVIKLENMHLEDFCFNENYEDIIILRHDIDIACKKLNIKKPLCIDEAKKISDYLNKEYM